jgi:hypothetical protein
MATVSVYIAQGFAQKGRRLIADQAIPCKTAQDAVRRAERLATIRVGAVAIQQNVDDDTGEVGEDARILFRAGSLPPSFGDE